MKCPIALCKGVGSLQKVKYMYLVNKTAGESSCRIIVVLATIECRGFTFKK